MSSSKAASKAAPANGTMAQGIILCIISTFSTAASLLIAPILPRIIEAFASDPQAEAKVILALTVPALIVALTAPFAGRIAEKWGRKNLLMVSLILYIFCGLAPFFLNDLNQIILTRVGVGIAESGFMTASTTLIGDYFKGRKREGWLVAQTSAASVSAIFLMIIGGALGDISWRMPFLVYASPLLLLPLAMMLLREPEHEAHEAAVSGFPWMKVMPLYVVALFAAILFFVVPVQTPFLLTGRGMDSPQLIGLTSAIGAVAVPVGGIAYKFLSHYGLLRNLALAFALIAGGLWLFVGDGSYEQTLAGIILTSFGCGMTLPALLTAIMSKLSFDQRGRGTGGWQTAFFLGNFLSPIIILGLTAKLQGLDKALLTLGAIGGAAFVLVVMTMVLSAVMPRKVAVYSFPPK